MPALSELSQADHAFVYSMRTSGGPAFPVRSQGIAFPAEPGRVHEVNRETFDYFLECLPPKFMGQAGFSFGFAEGQEPLMVFWRSGGRHYARLLTWDETNRLCDVIGMPRVYWY